MAKFAGHKSLLRPASIAIHNDADVTGTRCLGLQSHESGFSG
jgi:hypothetical protein